MNIGSFLYRGQALYGVFADEKVAPARSSLVAQFPTLRALLAGPGADALRDPANVAAEISCRDILFQPPIPDPGKIICVGMNYAKPYPVDGVAPANPEHIILFGKERETLVGHGVALEMPSDEPANSFDYEGEIAAVIAKTARHVAVAEALDYVLGYSLFNDGSVRDWQKHSIYAGKNFANSGAWGPWITTADRLPPVESLQLSVTLNGETVQSAYGREMIFPLTEIVAYASSLFTLQPGDVIATGSPAGTGGGRTPKRYLKSKDVLRITCPGIGSLVNTVS
jgi:2-keto-4-pentenoate hydratase/2-oxohepta-3-ene-1,7-dioic acid hydratase in catechol pathway